MKLILRLIIMYLRSRLPAYQWPDMPETDAPVDGADVPDTDPSTDVIHTKAVINDDPEPSPNPAPAPAPAQRYCWCIDAGHGALQPGKRSPIIPELGVRFYEYAWNREIAKGIIAELEYLGIEHFEVVPEINVDDFLVERVSRANNHPSLLPKIFLSIHANAGPSPNLDTWNTDSSGTETWYFHGSRLGRNLAATMQRHLVNATGFKNRHVRSKAEGQFYVLRATRMVATLTESGFYNFQAEVMKLIDPEMKRRIIKAHVAAIIEIEENGL